MTQGSEMKDVEPQAKACLEERIALADRARKFLEQPHTLDIGDVMQLVADMRKGLSSTPGSAWQAMESAPKDGTQILVCFPKSRAMAVVDWVIFDDGDGAWNDGCGDVMGMTHWMPLPQAPSYYQASETSGSQ